MKLWYFDIKVISLIRVKEKMDGRCYDGKDA